MTGQGAVSRNYFRYQSGTRSAIPFQLPSHQQVKCKLRRKEKFLMEMEFYFWEARLRICLAEYVVDVVEPGPDRVGHRACAHVTTTPGGTIK